MTRLTRSDDVDRFLKAADDAPLARASGERGRLIFALDATASRQPTWDRAMSLQGDMFTNTRAIAALDVQLVYYRGYRECRASGWLSSAERVLGAMQKIRCEAGRTQLARVLRHAKAETGRDPVQALVFVGDAVEEDIDALGDLAGQLGLLRLPVFLFQEGAQPAATRAFKSIARLSGGAHCRFDEGSAAQLGRLLVAVAAYATGGASAVERLGTRESGALLEQLR